MNLGQLIGELTARGSVVVERTVERVVRVEDSKTILVGRRTHESTRLGPDPAGRADSEPREEVRRHQAPRGSRKAKALAVFGEGSVLGTQVVAIKVGVSHVYAGQLLTRLRGEGLIRRVEHGRYEITDAGRERLAAEGLA